MPTAALADVHGNLHALDAVLADPRLADADGIVVLGDAGPYEGRPGAYWALLGPDVELVRTEYDVEAAADAEPAAETLLHPRRPDEGTAWWEESRVPR